MLRAVADIGSNTVKYGVYEYDGDDRLPKRKAFGTKTLKLIGKIKDGVLPEYAISELSALLCEYKSKAYDAGAESFDIFATAWIRATQNGKEICDEIEKAVGTKVDILSGDEEARLSNTALYAEAKPQSGGICADMGGGSTEIVRFNGGNVAASKSMPFGCVVLKNKFVKGQFPTGEETTDIEAFVQSNLYGLEFDVCADTFCIVGGTAKALLTLNRKLFGSDFTPDSFGKLLDALTSSPSLEALLTALVPERVDTALPGLIAFKAICDKVAPKNVIIVSSGTREGFIIDRYRKED